MLLPPSTNKAQNDVEANYLCREDNEEDYRRYWLRQTHARDLRELKRVLNFPPCFSAVTNSLVEDYVRVVLPAAESLCFCGVFSADTIPSWVHSLEMRRLCLIVNLNRADSDDRSQFKHFVVILLTPTLTTYIDPFGDECADVDVLQFLISRGRPTRVSNERIQNRLSPIRSLYAILFALRFLAPGGPRPELSWEADGDLSNDDSCVRLLREMVADTRVRIMRDELKRVTRNARESEDEVD